VAELEGEYLLKDESSKRIAAASAILTFRLKKQMRKVIFTRVRK